VARNARGIVLALLAALLASASASGSATITVVNGNQPGVGFNDPAPATPVGGNTGTTLGQQRLMAFQHAADIWGALIDSTVEIRIRATFEALDCTADTAVLGAASPNQVFSDFPNAPLAGTWFPSALANRLAGQDLSSTDDDIVARFNVNLGNTGCFDGIGWYYGLDNNHGNSIDLVAVLLHEFSHGLGFLTFVSDQGVEFQNQPDVFEREIFDDTVNKHWTEMTEAERGVSAVNTGHVLWDGPTVTAMAPQFLGGTPALTIDSPASVAGNFVVSTAQFGPDVSEDAIAGQIVAAIDPADAAGMATTDGCTAFSNASVVAGKIALIDRGSCDFVDKSANAEAAGVIAVIIANNVPEGLPPLGVRENAPTIHIPTVGISQADGATIRAALGGSGVTGRIHINARMRAGEGSGGRLKLYAPNPDEPGSSISHWDTSAFPNLLMEPNLTGSLPHTVDLTLPLLYDIGWRPDTSPAPVARGAVETTTGTGEPKVVTPRP
jgi:hypothetical protein